MCNAVVPASPARMVKLDSRTCRPTRWNSASTVAHLEGEKCPEPVTPQRTAETNGCEKLSAASGPE